MKTRSIPENLITRKFISPKELRDILGISLPTIYRMVDSRLLPAYKIGNSLRFLKDDVIAYLEAQRIDPFI